MSREMDLLRRLAGGDNRGDFFISLELLKEIEEILTLPEQGQTKCCVCGTTENVKWVGGHQPYRCGSRNCVPF
jgi:hypothetical protein